MEQKKLYVMLFAAIVLALCCAPSFALAATNINSNPLYHWAWSDAVGWINFYSSHDIVVGPTSTTGNASSSAGFFSLDCHTSPAGNICGTSNYQVLNDGLGHLSGWAWNDALGWVSFCGGAGTSNCPGSISYQVDIDSSGNFSGYAWNDAIGWIDFSCYDSTCLGPAGYWYVNTSWLPSTSEAGYLDSTTFDTGSASGSQLNSVLWYGSQPGGTSVGFQFAVSNTSSGPWNYTGPDNTSSTYYTSLAPSVNGSLVPIPLNYQNYSGFRYFRYRTTLNTNTLTSTPEVSQVIVNWSP